MPDISVLCCIWIYFKTVIFTFLKEKALTLAHLWEEENIKIKAPMWVICSWITVDVSFPSVNAGIREEGEKRKLNWKTRTERSLEHLGLTYFQFSIQICIWGHYMLILFFSSDFDKCLFCFPVFLLHFIYYRFILALSISIIKFPWITAGKQII